MISDRTNPNILYVMVRKCFQKTKTHLCPLSLSLTKLSYFLTKLYKTLAILVYGDSRALTRCNNEIELHLLKRHPVVDPPCVSVETGFVVYIVYHSSYTFAMVKLC